jgi:putative tryptophan/tyrosine transport system substrate-binding protein
MTRLGHRQQLTDPRQFRYSAIAPCPAGGIRMQLSPLTRRKFIALAGGAAVAWPLTAGAQEPSRMQRIGFLAAFGETDPVAQSWLAAFREELRKLGWMEGRNIEIDTCWAKADVESTKRCSKELVALQPDVILTVSTPVTAATLQLTRTIPIVFVLVADPVGSGFVASLSQPGGNATNRTAPWGCAARKLTRLTIDMLRSKSSKSDGLF